MHKDYRKYLVQPESIAKLYESVAGSSIKTKNANFSEIFGFKRLGIHHVTLPPDCRTSFPHAESLEEEFVFVISGNPHAWIDGYVYELKPHCAVGFPSGTGISHSFINNTQKNVELLVVGERTKKDNLCIYTVNPEEKAHSSIWWEDAPKKDLGPHNGKPGPVKPNEIGDTWPACIVDLSQRKRSKGWHYAGDSETFGEYTRLTDPAGLKVLGIGCDVLYPGDRSAFPHAHKVEEEFVYILSGTATIWINGFTAEASAGTGVGFPSGTNFSHCVINDSSEPLVYIVVGEATEDAGKDAIIYPQHPFRNEQCRKIDYYWEDRPKDVVMGPHLGRSQKGIPEHLYFKHAEAKDEEEILGIFKRSMAYFSKVDGAEPTFKTVRHALHDGPQKRTNTYHKEFLTIQYKDQPVGVLDLHIDHPEKGIAYVGLLLLTEDLFSKGLGRRSYALMEDYLKRIHQIETLRLGISDANDVRGFWEKMGFKSNGHSYSWKGEDKTTMVTEYEKSLT